VFDEAAAALSVATVAHRLDQGQAPETAVHETFERLDAYGNVVAERLVDAYVESGQGAAAELQITIEQDITQTAIREEAGRWARRHALGLTRKTVIGEHRDVLRDLREMAVRRGWTSRTLAQRMRDHVGLTRHQSGQVARFYNAQLEDGVRESWARSRAHKLANSLRRTRAQTIARTSIVDAVQEGKQRLWTRAQADGQVSPTAQQRWRAQPDATDAVCVALDGVMVPLGADFGGGYSRPPVHPRCRCDLELVPDARSAPSMTARQRDNIARTEALVEQRTADAIAALRRQQGAGDEKPTVIATPDNATG